MFDVTGGGETFFFLQQEVHHGAANVGRKGEFSGNLWRVPPILWGTLVIDDITGFRRGRRCPFPSPQKRCPKQGFFFFFFFNFFFSFFFLWTYKAMLLRLPSCVVMTGSRKNIKWTVTSSELLFIVWFRLIMSDTLESGKEKARVCWECIRKSVIFLVEWEVTWFAFFTEVVHLLWPDLKFLQTVAKSGCFREKVTCRLPLRTLVFPCSLIVSHLRESAFSCDEQTCWKHVCGCQATYLWKEWSLLWPLTQCFLISPAFKWWFWTALLQGWCQGLTYQIALGGTWSVSSIVVIRFWTRSKKFITEPRKW